LNPLVITGMPLIPPAVPARIAGAGVLTLRWAQGGAHRGARAGAHRAPAQGGVAAGNGAARDQRD